MARLDAAEAGFPLQVYVAVTLQQHGEAAHRRFAEAVRAMPEVISADWVTGETDAMLLVVAREVAELQRVLVRLSTRGGAARVMTLLRLEELKPSSPLPLEPTERLTRHSEHERRHEIAVRPQQLVDELLDLVERQLGRGVRVEHRGVVNGLAAPGQRRGDGQALDVYVGLDQRGEVTRQRSHGTGLDPALAATHGTSTQHSPGRLSISWTPAVALGTFPLNANGSPVVHALMMSAPYSLLRSPRSMAPFCSPACNSIHSWIWRSHRRGYSSSGIAYRSIRSGPARLDEPRHVLGEVLGGLGHEVTEAAQDLEPDLVLGWHPVGLDEAAQARV